MLHRVTWVDPGWERLQSGMAFHPLFVPVDRQGYGRFDNPHLYAALYLSTTPAGAVGETFGNLARWPSDEIGRVKEGRPRCLVGLTVPDDLVVLDLDDPAVLVDLGLRPSDVVRRNRDHTQEVANRTWRDRAPSGVRGLTWWSYLRPESTNVVLWSEGLEQPHFPLATVETVETLTIDHVAVQTAADVLPRELGSR